MGFFKEIGRQVEQFKQPAKKTAEEDATLQCRVCDTRLNVRHNECPACGATNLTQTSTEG